MICSGLFYQIIGQAMQRLKQSMGCQSFCEQSNTKFCLIQERVTYFFEMQNYWVWISVMWTMFSFLMGIATMQAAYGTSWSRTDKPRSLFRPMP